MSRKWTLFEPQAHTAMRILLSNQSLRDRLGHATLVERYAYWRDLANQQEMPNAR